MSSDLTEADVVVVGLGAMGAAVTHHAAALGMSVIGIDRFDPPHTRGSTHAETRVTRLAVGEGPEYLPFVARSHELWRELEAFSGEALLHPCGGLIVAESASDPSRARWKDFVTATEQIAVGAGVAFDRPTPREAEAAHPTLRIPATSMVGFEPTAGLVMNERTLALQLDRAHQLGATIRRNERVIELHPGADTVEIVTERDRFRARHVVLATGPWMPEMIPAGLGQLSVTRQVVFWFEAEDLDVFSTERHPFLMWMGGSDQDYFALFPTPPGGTPAVKVLTEQFARTTTPDEVDRTVDEDEGRLFHEQFIEPHVVGLTSSCVRAEVCLYTSTPEDRFVIDHDPRSDRITLMSPCSGHGFKHSAALGEAVAQQLATGSSTLDLGPFALR